MPERRARKKRSRVVRRCARPPTMHGRNMPRCPRGGAGDHDKIVKDADDMQVAFNDMAKSGVALRKMQFDQARQAYDAGQQSYDNSRIVSIAAILLGVAG